MEAVEAAERVLVGQLARAFGKFPGDVESRTSSVPSSRT